MTRIRPYWVMLAGIIAGCGGTDTADKAASLALHQLGTYESEVAAKIAAEEHYYETVMDNTVNQINRLREGQQRWKFEAEAQGFAEARANASVDTIKAALPAFLKSARDSWAARDDAYDKLTTETKEKLAKNRKQLEIEKAKIKKLKNQLRALSEPRSRKDMLTLLIAFTKEVKTKLDQANADSKGAEKTASTATGEK